MLDTSKLNDKFNKKCAPSKKFTDGSCFTLDNLKDIALSYNSKNSDKIKITDNKKMLLNELNNKMR